MSIQTKIAEMNLRKHFFAFSSFNFNNHICHFTRLTFYKYRISSVELKIDVLCQKILKAATLDTNVLNSAWNIILIKYPLKKIIQGG